MRVLHTWHDHDFQATAGTDAGARRRGNPARHRGQSLPLHRLSTHCQCGESRVGEDGFLTRTAFLPLAKGKRGETKRGSYFLRSPCRKTRSAPVVEEPVVKS